MLRATLSRFRRSRADEFVSRSRSAVFEDVTIAPYEELLDAPRGKSNHKGGPLWPDWDAQAFPRHCHMGIPADTRPSTTQPSGVPIDEIAWGGAIVGHFGHQVADFSARLLATGRERSDLPIAFAARAGTAWTSVEEAPAFVGAILDWYHIEPHRRVLISEPTTALSLFVAEQAEQLGGPGPNEGHLDALDELTVRNLQGQPTSHDGVVYVSRAAMHARFAGEAYLESRLEAAGVRVMRPESMPLAEQIRTYQSAPVLVFAEGSALHTLQLSGRIEGSVVVLVRRNGATLGKWSLQPRTRDLRYVEVSDGIVCGLLPTGAPAEMTGISLLSVEATIMAFGDLGVDIGAGWNTQAFAQSTESDIRAWLADEPKRPEGAAERTSEIVRRLEGHGLETLARAAPGILSSPRRS